MCILHVQCASLAHIIYTLCSDTWLFSEILRKYLLRRNMSRNILRKLTVVLLTISCQTHSQISRNAAVSSQNTEDLQNLTDEKKRLQALQYTTTMFTPNRWAKYLWSRKQDFFFALKYSNDIQLGQLRLNPPGLGSKCGKRVERLSDF